MSLCHRCMHSCEPHSLCSCCRPVTVTSAGTAAHHQAHKDDPKEWNTTSEDADVQPSGSVTFSLRLPAVDLADLRDRAAFQGVSVSEMVRLAIRTLPRAQVRWMSPDDRR